MNTTSLYEEYYNCRVCREGVISEVLSLSSQPPANYLIDPSGSNKVQPIPLTFGICQDCGTLQLRETIKAENLYTNYTWVSGTGATTRAFSFEFELMVRSEIGGYSRVLEFASNDGTFLKPFQRNSEMALGVEPAENIVKIALAEGCETVHGFYSPVTAQLINEKYGGDFDLIFGRNVVAHVNDPQQIATSVEINLSENGCLIVEVHDALKILEQTQYDSIYHEHIFFHTLKSLGKIFGSVGLRPFHVIEGPLSGGSLIVFLDRGIRKVRDSIYSRQTSESRALLGNAETWLRFSDRAKSHITSLGALVKRYEGKVYAFGQSARGTVLLHCANLDRRYVAGVIDNSPLKQGKTIPQLGVGISSLDQVSDSLSNIEAILILAWNFEQEISQQLRLCGYRGDIIVPFPDVDIKRFE